MASGKIEGASFDNDRISGTFVFQYHYQSKNTSLELDAGPRGEAHVQHDICEFFSFLMQRDDCGMFAGLWQARSPGMAGALHPLDERSRAQPIKLPLPSNISSRPPRVQSLIEVLIEDCHRSVDGLVVVPPAISLQLRRFTRVRGRIATCSAKVMIDKVIHVPVFNGERHTIDHVEYELCAYVEHHGATPQAGHYAAVLYQGGQWDCDDGRIAKWQTEAANSQLRSWLLYCLRTALHVGSLRNTALLLSGSTERCTLSLYVR